MESINIEYVARMVTSSPQGVVIYCQDVGARYVGKIEGQISLRSGGEKERKEHHIG
jgi:hypothetical protein